jgi:hexosaminidase
MRIFFGLSSLFFAVILHAQEISIIPKPASMVPGKGVLRISSATRIRLEGSGLEPSADFLNDYLQKVYGFRLGKASPEDKNDLIILNYERLDYPIPGAYRMNVDDKNIYVAGDNAEGVFYGIQTLLQLLPVEPSSPLVVPQLTIEDHPRFAYRGLHLDVGRHFFTVDYIKRYIDYIALHKMNYFHWHLTEDQGWRIEIKKYPRLTEVGSCRNGTIIGRYPGKGNDSLRYCGYYTQDEIRDVVKYAAARYITIIPEIELPGHASAALMAYPFLGCTGGPYQVQQTWGVFNDVFCAGNDSTFRFLEDVLDEVIALFPSKYIHIGGDECPKVSWKKCPKCQRRIKDNNLKDEHELQSYFIQRIEKYINSKGKQIIGWDEILEGGLAPNAAVMSWRGEKGGIAAAEQHHTVIMTPTTYVYFDYAQKKNEDSVVIGGYLPIEAVYNYEPLPKSLGVAEQKYIVGAQANVWTEYMGSQAKLEYMLFPRLSALSEVLWSPRDLRDWNDFQKRLPAQFKRYERWKANYSKAYYDLKVTILPKEDRRGMILQVETKFKTGEIRVQYPDAKLVIQTKELEFMGENPPSVLAKKLSEDLRFPIDRPGEYSIAYLGDEKQEFATPPITAEFHLNKATGKKITLTTAPAVEFPGNGGAFGLVNGILTEKYGNFSEWLGWSGSDMEALIDLNKEDSISSINIHTLDQKRGRYYQPAFVEAFASSNGIDFTSLGKTAVFVPDHDNIGSMTLHFPVTAIRYVKVFAKNSGIIPDGQPGAGNLSRMLIDEIQMN